MFDKDQQNLEGQLPRKRDRSAPRQTGDWIRVSLMGLFLALIVFVTFFYQPSGTAPGPILVEDTLEATPVPLLDTDILADVDDETRGGRLEREPEALKHLLEKSLAVTPAVARKLEMPERPLAFSRLRRNPGFYRGKYLWYKGELEYLSKPILGHPVQGYQYYEGRLRTVEDERVLFAFSVPPHESLQVGSGPRWCPNSA